MKPIKFIPDDEFKKMTKKQKLALPSAYQAFENPIKLLFIPVTYKMDWWGVGAKFVQMAEWWVRIDDYDCFTFYNVWSIFKWDFEYGGVCFFFSGKWGTVDYHSFTNK